MTDDLERLDGVGPARAENLEEAGYETFEDIAEADHEQLSEDISYLTADTALELVVQSQNITDLEEAEVEEEPELEEEEEDDAESQSASETSQSESETEDETEPEVTSAEEPVDVEFTLSFEGPIEYDAFYHTVYTKRNNLIRTNRGTEVEAYEKMLDELREAGPAGEITVMLEPQELHDLHNAVRSQIVDYRGEGLMDQHDSLQQLKQRVDAIREEKLF